MTSAIHGEGFLDIIERVVAPYPEIPEEDKSAKEIRIAIVGQPNAGILSLLILFIYFFVFAFIFIIILFSFSFLFLLLFLFFIYFYIIFTYYFSSH